MASTISFLTEGQLKFFLLCDRVIQWLSTVIVLGITSSFINRRPRGLTIVYVEIVVSILESIRVTCTDEKGRCFCGRVFACLCNTLPDHTDQGLCSFH